MTPFLSVPRRASGALRHAVTVACIGGPEPGSPARELLSGYFGDALRCGASLPDAVGDAPTVELHRGCRALAIGPEFRPPT